MRLALALFVLLLSGTAHAKAQVLDARAYFPPCEVGEVERGWVYSGRAASTTPTGPGECVRVNGAAARRYLRARCCAAGECSEWSGPARDGDGSEVCS